MPNEPSPIERMQAQSAVPDTLDGERAAREAVANYYRLNNPKSGMHLDIMRDNWRDGASESEVQLVQAIAERIAALSSQPVEAEGRALLQEARGQIVGFMLECGHSPEAAVANVARIDAFLSTTQAGSAASVHAGGDQEQVEQITSP